MIRKRHYLNEGIADRVPNAKLRDLIEFCRDYCEQATIARNDCSTYEEYAQRRQDIGYLDRDEMLNFTTTCPYDGVKVWMGRMGYGAKDVTRVVQDMGGLDSCLTLIKIGYYNNRRGIGAILLSLLDCNAVSWLYGIMLGACIKYKIPGVYSRY